MKEQVAIIGLGFVGSAIFQTFKNHFKVETYDINKEKCTVPSIKDLMSKCNIIFVCVPTPIFADSGACCLDSIHSVYSKLNKYGNGHTIILKSSVPPGSSKMLNAEYRNVKTVFNPEFLREATAIEDYANQDRIVLGGDGAALTQAEELHMKVFPNVPIYTTDTTTAEMTKFMINIFLATKVSLSNEFYKICEKLEIHYDEVRRLAVTDPRIGLSHTQIPGNGTPTSKGGFGVSGSCFPVNLEILIHTAQMLGVDPKIMKAVRDRNNEYDRPEMDWKIEGKTIVYNKKEAVNA